MPESEDNEQIDVSDAEIESAAEELTFEKEDEQPKDTIKRLREKLKECTAKKQEYLSGWQRAKADLVNAKKEFDDKKDRIRRQGKERVVETLLPALDSFEAAMANTQAWESVDEEWRTGVEQIHKQLTDALEASGVQQIRPEPGTDFDPQVHASVETKPTDDQSNDNTIADCQTTGYRIDDKVIRSADVTVYTIDETEGD